MIKKVIKKLLLRQYLYVNGEVSQKISFNFLYIKKTKKKFINRTNYDRNIILDNVSNLSVIIRKNIKVDVTIASNVTGETIQAEQGILYNIEQGKIRIRIPSKGSVDLGDFEFKKSNNSYFESIKLLKEDFKISNNNYFSKEYNIKENVVLFKRDSSIHIKCIDKGGNISFHNCYDYGYIPSNSRITFMVVSNLLKNEYVIHKSMLAYNHSKYFKNYLSSNSKLAIEENYNMPLISSVKKFTPKKINGLTFLMPRIHIDFLTDNEKMIVQRYYDLAPAVDSQFSFTRFEKSYSTFISENAPIDKVVDFIVEVVGFDTNIKNCLEVNDEMIYQKISIGEIINHLGVQERVNLQIDGKDYTIKYKVEVSE